MTLPSPKKRPTTARKPARATCRKRLAYTALLPALIAAGWSRASADNGWTPVPKVRSTAMTPPATSASRDGWQLQWRTSATIEQEKNQAIADAAFRAAPPRGESVASVAVTPAPSEFQRTTWLMQSSPSRESGFALPSPAPAGQAPKPTNEPSWFDNPFRDDGSSANATSQSNNTLPAPAQPSVTPKGSIRDLLQDAPGTAPTPMPHPPASSNPRPIVQEEAAEPENIPSPSDRDLFDANPFGKPKPPLSEREESGPVGNTRKNDFDPTDNAVPPTSGTGLSCEEFRSRIAAETIDQVSLDISPPFRPDVIEQAEYEKLKGRFDKNQELRTWRGIDGRPLGTGRLKDLAYEKAIIMSDFGTKEELPIDQLSEPDLAYISENWGLPTECLIEQVAYQPRQWTPTTMTYKASNLCHKPLYFEEVNLERYGHTAGPVLQPFVSSAHFFVNIAVLPYKMGVHLPSECQYALGYYRPGNCAPWIVPPIPISLRGALYQAGAVATTAALVP